MEFWRIYRLIHSKRWLILAIMLIAATVIFAGVTLRSQRKIFEAEALVEPQDATLLDTVTRASGTDGSSNPQSIQQARSNNISDLIMLLRTSNDLYFKAADLMQATEEERAKEVQRILERNGYFASWDAQDEQQAQRLVRLGELTPAQAKQQLAKARAETRKNLVAEWAKARDDLGAFAPTGVTQSDLQIAAKIRDKMFFDSVADPLSTENNPQVVNLIKIRSRFEREAEATLYTNMMVVAFIDYFTNKSSSAATAQMARLRDKLEQAQRALHDAQAREVAYRKTTSDTVTADQNSAVGLLVNLERERDNAASGVAEANAAIGALNRMLTAESRVKTTALPSSENEQVRKLEARVADAEIAFSRIRESNLGEAHELYRSAQAELNRAKQELAAARQRPFSTSTVNPAYDVLRGQLADATRTRGQLQEKLTNLNAQVARQQAVVQRMPAAQMALRDLRREVLIREENVTNLQKALGQAELNDVGQGRAGSINILSRAYTTPVGADIGKQRWKLMAYGMVLALIFGIALVVAMDALDNSIRTTTDVEKLLGLPICGVIPAQLPDPNRSPRITYLDPLSPVAEAYRLLRTDLLFTNEERPFQSLMVSTGKPGQGASTTICNLAIAFAQAGKRVILVDCDLRRPKLHNIFKVRNETGLTSILNGECTLEEALKPTEVDNLLILPSGPLPLNPAELIASQRMRGLHEELKRHSDFVLFDTPSAIAFSDATILSSFVDAAIIVVRAHNVPRGSEHQVRNMLNKAKANIIGVVLNGMNPEHVDSVHYHYHYYPVLTSKNTMGALPSAPNGNGNGHGKPLALTGGGSEAEDPVVTARRSATVTEPAGKGGGSATATSPRVDQRVGGDGAKAAAPVPATAAPGVVEAEAARSAVSSHEGFLQVKRRSIWRRMKGIVLFLVVGLVIGAMVLFLQNSVQP